MPNTDSFSGVSNCYVFKSRLQEYAQKAGLLTPVYETIKEGPSHEPSFRSTVIVNDIRYVSLPGFFNRKAAEQSAAEVALLELSKSGEVGECISQPVHETGLCKNLLQEYAQKMNYAIPLYICQKDELSGRRTLFTCTVEIGGIRYIGAAAGTKKEAEIKAARTALIAIQSSTTESSDRIPIRESQLTVLPCKKRGLETASASIPEETIKSPKPKKARNKKNASKRKLPRDNLGHTQVANAEYSESKIAEGEASNFPMRQWAIEPMSYPESGSIGIIPSGMENFVASFCQKGDNSQNGISSTLNDGHKQLDTAEYTESTFVEANGYSTPIAQQTVDPLRYPQLGGSSVISNEAGNAGEMFYHCGFSSSQNLQLCTNIVTREHDASVTEMPSLEYGDIHGFLEEVEEESRAGEVGALSGNHSHAGNMETSSTIICAGFSQSGETIQAGAI